MSCLCMLEMHLKYNGIKIIYICFNVFMYYIPETSDIHHRPVAVVVKLLKTTELLE